ncbi:FkbM family methyltransferase [Chroococcidiopsis sp.]|uniref:FkbM family methyltransferase n=1 Tax=Chroococcidiopsis sp. TaxID=3088168 RepID=UPI003F67BCEA
MSYQSRTNFKKVVLPNGMEIFCLQKEEIFIIYDQIQEYFRNGIELKAGNTVFDVGANIGMFSLWVDRLCAGNVSIYAFEPMPEVFQVLEENSKSCQSEKIKVLPYGLSRSSKTQIFSYYPNLTSISTAYFDESKEEKDKFKKAAMQKITNIRNSSNLSSPLSWYTKIPRFLLSFILDIKVEKAFQSQQVTCQMKTLSEAISDWGVQQIDLLKIDVEKSELDVLLGIAEADWAKIKQIVLEVHDLDCRVEKITSLLSSKGFSEVIVEQENYLNDTEIFNMYALRSKSNL